MQKRLKKRIRKTLGLSPFDCFENYRRYSQLCGIDWIDFHSPFSNLTVTRTTMVIGGIFQPRNKIKCILFYSERVSLSAQNVKHTSLIQGNLATNLKIGKSFNHTLSGLLTSSQNKEMCFPDAQYSPQSLSKQLHRK